MKVFCLGAAGRISRESALDLVQYSDFEKITIGDYNLEEAKKVAEWLNDDRVDVVKIDVTKVDDHHFIGTAGNKARRQNWPDIFVMPFSYFLQPPNRFFCRFLCTFHQVLRRIAIHIYLSHHSR